jgi:cellulose synthase/poly-beta-1,6-N-acetylglucosamine synthase-like glycosyltransferase
VVHVLNTILITLSVLSLISFFYWGIGFLRTLRTRRGVPTARAGLNLPDLATWPSVCIVIPAHNEEHVIGELTRTLAAQDYPNLRIAFALDRCTDGTEAAIRAAAGSDPRFMILRVTECPAGWAGKVHAVWRAVTDLPAAHDADLLLFADADTLFEPRCVSACVKLLLQRGAGMVSLLSTLTTDKWFERLIQPATTLELFRQFPPLRTNRGPGTRAMANGQFMLFRRDTYFELGGHESVKDEMLEDMALAHRVKSLGQNAEVYFADGMLICRMYETWPAFVSGWKRLFIDLAHRRPHRLAKSAFMCWFFGTLLPLAAVAAIVLGVVSSGHPWIVTVILAWIAVFCGIIGLAAYIGCIFAGFSRGGWPIISLLTYPAAAAVTAWILKGAQRDLERGVPVRWAGREYVRVPRGRDEKGFTRPGVIPQVVPPKGTMLGRAS